MLMSHTDGLPPLQRGELLILPVRSTLWSVWPILGPVAVSRGGRYLTANAGPGSLPRGRVRTSPGLGWGGRVFLQTQATRQAGK